MDWLEGKGYESEAATACSMAVAYLAVLRYNRVNDISHEDMGRKVKIDKENEARPFEWQLARDDRMHLEEYYRALDRMIDSLQTVEAFKSSDLYQRMQALIVSNADMLAQLTGVDASPWLFVRMVPFLTESQLYVEKAYGENFHSLPTSQHNNLLHAAQMAVTLGGIALMGRRCALTALPYGLMKVVEGDGAGTVREQPSADLLDSYLRHLSKEQHYWLNEMKLLRDETAGNEAATMLQMPENDKHNPYIRL
jgi:hypothetical protein